MDAYEPFHELLKNQFSPLLRADGFKGSGNTFRRMKGERIDIVNIQGSRYGGRCCVNVAAHFSFLPTAGGRVADLKKLKEYECTFRDRLHESQESDHWWSYGEGDAEAETSVASLIDMYKRRAGLFFGRFEPFPDVFERITPAEMDAGDYSRMPAAMTGVCAALTMARIMKHLGRLEKCREFAIVGLKNLGHAVGLKAELERLRDAR
jgi:Domain of unknown function (DUF4304)